MSYIYIIENYKELKWSKLDLQTLHEFQDHISLKKQFAGDIYNDSIHVGLKTRKTK